MRHVRRPAVEERRTSTLSRRVRGAAILLVVLALPVTALWLLQRRLVFQPDNTDPGPAGAVLAGARDITLATSDGLQLGAWYLPAATDCGITVLVTPGNAGNRGGRADLAGALAAQGLGVLLLDYRGYGGNPGSPDEPGILRDALAAREFLAAEVPTHAIVYFGESLGAAVAVALATRVPPSALVLRSPFVDLAAAAGHQFPWLPVRAMLWDELQVQQPLSRLSAPVAVVYGDQDSLIPPEQSLAVASAANRALTVRIPGADHNDAALVSGPAVVDAVISVSHTASDAECIPR